MQIFEFVGGAVDPILHVFIEDTRVDDGAGLTGLTYNSPGLTCDYIKTGQTAPTTLALIDTSVGAHADGGFKEISAANMPGWYELQLPDSTVEPGFGRCSVVVRGAANMAVTNVALLEAPSHRRFVCRYPYSVSRS